MFENVFYTLGFVGMTDLIVQAITKGEVTLIQTTLAAIFGGAT